MGKGQLFGVNMQPYVPCRLFRVVLGVAVFSVLAVAGDDAASQPTPASTMEESLRIAVQLRRQDDICKLLAGNVSVNYQDESDRSSVLHLAAQYCGNPGLIKQLLDRGANISALDQIGRTALHVAVEFRDEAGVISELLARGADVNARTGSDRTVLHAAVEFRSRPEIVRLLLEKGANPNARGLLGDTVLHTAVNFRGETAVIRLLLDRGADANALNNDGYTPLLTALRSGHYIHKEPERLYAVADLLLARGASAKIAGKNGELPVRAAMDPLNLPLMRLLGKHGAVLPVDGLYYALGSEKVDLAKFFMDVATPAMLAYKDASGAGVLHKAAEYTRMAFAMEWLVRKGANINAADNDGKTPFAAAAWRNNIPGMTWLAANKADTRAVDADGWSPLHFAASWGRHEGMRWLVERGADIRARDKSGRTPLELAIDTKDFAYYDDATRLEVVTMLGGSAADIARGRFSVHPLYDALYRQNLAQMEKLLKAGADPNRKTADGHLPLGMALWMFGASETRAQREFAEKAIPLLLRHGADPKLKMDDGKTPEERARQLRKGDDFKRMIERYSPRGK